MSYLFLINPIVISQVFLLAPLGECRIGATVRASLHRLRADIIVIIGGRNDIFVEALAKIWVINQVFVKNERTRICIVTAK